MSFFYIVFGLVSQMVLVSESSHGLGLLPAHYICFSFPKAVSRDTTSHLHVFLGICGKQHLLPSCNYLCRVWRTPATSDCRKDKARGTELGAHGQYFLRLHDVFA